MNSKSRNDEPMDIIEQLKSDIDLREYAADFGYTEHDRNKFTSTCIILRRREDNGKVGVSRDGTGRWLCYDFRQRKGGSILDFVMREKGCNFGEAKRELLNRLGGRAVFLSPTAITKPSLQQGPAPRRSTFKEEKTLEIKDRHPYLASRGIKKNITSSYRFTGMVHSDRYGNACFPYFNLFGLAGIERKNHNFKGYTKGGHKGLWHSNLWKSDRKISLFESPLDALSIACIYPDFIKCTRFFATGGQVGKYQWPLLDRVVAIANDREMQIVLAFDNDQAGRKMVEIFQARYPQTSFELKLPPAQDCDWNDLLMEKYCSNL